jgi:hypothetical protein
MRTQSSRYLAAAIALISILAAMPISSPAQQSAYTFRLLATIPGSAPGTEGGSFTFDFEPYGINNRDDVAFVADVTTGGEGVFLGRQDNLLQIARTGEPAPGGGTFDAFDLGRMGLNSQADAVFGFQLTPFLLPLGRNAGLYRYSGTAHSLTPIIVPGVTPAPGGGVFAGVNFNASLNNSGDAAFSAIVPTTAGISGNLGIGVFRTQQDQIAGVVVPGDAAPGGGVFDFAQNPWINSGGDIAFGAHVAGEACIDFGIPQSQRIFCAESVYVTKAATGVIESIAHQGDPAPGGGIYQYAFGPVLNNAGDIVFIGALTPPPNTLFAVFLNSHGSTISVARPGDPLPGGGNFMTAASSVSNYHLNNRGEVAFLASLNTDTNSDGIADSGLYVWSRGIVQLVARTGTDVPGVGTIKDMNAPGFVGLDPLHGGAVINDVGEVFFQATLTDGSGVLLVATP